MIVALGILAVLGWLAIGWLPSRVTKHYFMTCFAVLGDRAWCREDEVFSAGVAVLGPLAALPTLMWRLLEGTADAPWGWRW